MGTHISTQSKKVQAPGKTIRHDLLKVIMHVFHNQEILHISKKFYIYLGDKSKNIHKGTVYNSNKLQ